MRRHLKLPELQLCFEAGAAKPLGLDFKLEPKGIQQFWGLVERNSCGRFPGDAFRLASFERSTAFECHEAVQPHDLRPRCRGARAARAHRNLKHQSSLMRSRGAFQLLVLDSWTHAIGADLSTSWSFCLLLCLLDLASCTNYYSHARSVSKLFSDCCACTPPHPKLEDWLVPASAFVARPPERSVARQAKKGDSAVRPVELFMVSVVKRPGLWPSPVIGGCHVRGAKNRPTQGPGM